MNNVAREMEHLNKNPGKVEFGTPGARKRCAAARGAGSLTQSIRVRRNTLGSSD